jgi:tRNA G18 (ribose-2'-O)-methylase SpoU
VEVLLDNVRSLSNVGTIFRSSDGAGVTHIHLGGVTPTPDHPKLAKTALGAERSVAWTHHPDPVAATAKIAAAGTELWALEGGADVTLFELLPLPADRRVCLVVGHEVSGVDPRILEQCAVRAHLPMAGLKGSLNVAVAFSVAAYAIRHGLAPPV